MNIKCEYFPNFLRIHVSHYDRSTDYGSDAYFDLEKKEFLDWLGLKDMVDSYTLAKETAEKL